MNTQARQGERNRRDDRAEEHQQALQQLTREMSNQWRRAIGGFLALPSAIALGVASAAMFVGLFVERGFMAFEEVSRNVDTQAWRFGEQGGRPDDQTTREPPRA